MLEQSSETTEIDYICIATDLLETLMSELQCLRANNATLTLAMATAGHEMRQRLQILVATIDLRSQISIAFRLASINAVRRRLRRACDDTPLQIGDDTVNHRAGQT